MSSMPVMKFESAALNFAISRGFFDNCTDAEALDAMVSKSYSGGEKVRFYIGFDLTASGLHVGHLSNLMFIRGMIKHGCNVVVLLGGGTTYIGDPSGKEETRKMLMPEVIKQNKKSICQDIVNIIYADASGIKLDYDGEVVFDSGDGKVLIVDNFYWLMNLGYIDFLREVGVHFSVNKLIKMETFAKRLEEQRPLSFIEFNYPLLQAYDFYHLNKKHECQMQIGGSDQWGNIVRGVELISKMLPENKVFGYTLPLITRSDGKKMGKSENGAVWLSKNGLSDYDYMQYFRNVDDKDVSKFLRIFTEMEESEILDLERLEINQQKAILALEATKICRGNDAAEHAVEHAKKMFSNNLDEESSLECKTGTSILDMLFDLGMIDSKSEAKRVISSGGVKINNVMVNSLTMKVSKESILQDFPREGESYSGDFFAISIGKKKRWTVKIV